MLSIGRVHQRNVNRKDKFGKLADFQRPKEIQGKKEKAITSAI